MREGDAPTRAHDQRCWGASQEAGLRRSPCPSSRDQGLLPNPRCAGSPEGLELRGLALDPSLSTLDVQLPSLSTVSIPRARASPEPVTASTTPDLTGHRLRHHGVHGELSGKLFFQIPRKSS